MNSQKRIIVIGGAAAGPAAAAKAKRVDPSAEVILFESGNYISIGTCEIPYVLSGDISDVQKIIFYSPEKFLEEKGVTCFVNHHVTEIHPEKKVIAVSNLLENKMLRYSYDKLIIATGAVANRIPSLPSTLTNVFNLTRIDELISVKNYINTNKVSNVLLIGAGYIGLEAAEALSIQGFDITLIEKEKLPLPGTEPEMQYLGLDQLKSRKINFYSAFAKMKVIYDEDLVTGLNLDGRIIETDLVINCSGFKPNSVLAQQAKIKTTASGAILTDRKLKTSDPDIYAAGDCIEVINAVTSKTSYMPQAAIASKCARIAGENAAGGNKTYQPFVKNVAVKIFNGFHVSVGITSEEAAANNILYDSVYDYSTNLVEVMPGSRKTFGKIIYEKGSKRLLGASFFGGKEVSGYADLISVLIRLKQSAKVFAETDYNYTPPLSPFKNLLSILGRKAGR